jgi:hypothetical protein
LPALWIGRAAPRGALVALRLALPPSVDRGGVHAAFGREGVGHRPGEPREAHVIDAGADEGFELGVAIDPRGHARAASRDIHLGRC